VLFGRLLEKDIRPSIDKERDFGGISRSSSVSDSAGLFVCLTEVSSRRKTVLQVAPYSPAVDGETHRLPACLRARTIATFQIHGHGNIHGADDHTQIFDCQGERGPLAIDETVGVRD